MSYASEEASQALKPHQSTSDLAAGRVGSVVKPAPLLFRSTPIDEVALDVKWDGAFSSSEDNDNMDDENDEKKDDLDAAGEAEEANVPPLSQKTAIEEGIMSAALRTVPLQFVVQEMERRVSEGMVKHDLFYFVPFLLLFTVNYLVGRDIEQNYYANGAVRALVARNIYEYVPTEQAILEEYFRLDTNANYLNGTNQSDPFEAGWWKQSFLFSWFNSTYNEFYQPNATDNVIEQLARIAAGIQMQSRPAFLELNNKPDFLRWLRQALVPSLWDCKNPEYEATQRTRPRGNTALLGALRLRSIRMLPGLGCNTNPALVSSGAEKGSVNAKCYEGFASASVDSDRYCKQPNPTLPSEELFQYVDCGNSALTSRGTITDYPCVGHIATLPFSSSCSDVMKLMDLISPAISPSHSASHESNYTSVLDQLTENYVGNVFNRSACSSFAFHDSVRLVAVEFFSYTSATDALVRSRLLLEGTNGGLLVPTYSGKVFRIFSFQRHLLSLVLQLSLLSFSLYFLTKFWDDWGATTRKTGSRLEFLLDLWNLVDITNLICMIVNSALYVAWVLTSLHTVIDFNRSQKYPDLLEVIEYVYNTQVYCNSVNVILIFIKTLKYVRINDRLNILTRTFSHAQNNLLSLLALWIFIHIGFSLCGMQLFGASLFDYYNFNTAFSTLLFALLGKNNIEEMQRHQPILTHVFFWTFYIFENFMLLNFFVAILSDGFTKMSESVALAPLDVAVLRFLDEVLFTLRWKYLRERLLGLLRTNASRFELLIEVKLCLQDHLQLALRAATDVSRSHRDQVPTTFRDLQWWLPESLFNALGMQYLLVLWEDIVYEYYQSSCKSSHSLTLDNLGAAVALGVRDEIERDTPDVIALELQSELLSEKLSGLPVLLCQYDIVKRLSEKLNKTARQELQKKGANMGMNSSTAKRRRAVLRPQFVDGEAMKHQPQQPVLASAVAMPSELALPAELADSEDSLEGTSVESTGSESNARRAALAPFVAFEEN